MSEEEKKQLARIMLKRNGYTDSEIERIIELAFDKKDNARRNSNQD
jgi:hypothetical protein